MSASIWNPAGSSANVANADNNYKHQDFVVDATIASTGIFILTSFAYQTGTESLLVLVNGVDQRLTTDYTETSNTVVTIPGVKLEDNVTIRALVGSIASQSAATSATQAAIDAAAAHQAYLDTLALTPASLPLPVAQGGTGQITKSTGFAALAPALSGTSIDVGKVIGSSDGINFSLIPLGLGTVSLITGSISLTNLTISYHKIVMTSAGQVITMPDATTLLPGYPKAIFDNSKGEYAVLIRDKSANLISVINPGGSATVGLSDNSTVAGTWDIFGTELSAGAIIFDTVLSSSFASTAIPVYVSIDSNTSVHFVALTSNGFAAYVVDKVGKVITTPTTISVTASELPVAAFKLTATTLIVFYGVGTTTHKCAVITLTGSSPSFGLSVGTPQSLASTMVAPWEREDFVGAPKIAQLSATQFIASVVAGSNTGAVSISISGTAITIGAIVNISTANGCLGASNIYPLTATTALLIYKLAPSPYISQCVVTTVTAGVISFGAAVTVVGINSNDNTIAAASCALSATSFLVAGDTNGSNLSVNTINVAGTVVTSGGSAFSIDATISSTVAYTSFGATRSAPILYLNAAGATNYVICKYVISNINSVVVISETSGTLAKGSILASDTTASSLSRGYIIPQGTSSYLQISAEAIGGFGGKLVYSCSSVSSLLITPGYSVLAKNGATVASASDAVFTVKLSSGNTLIRDYSNVNGTGAGYHVVKTNGAQINLKGSIVTPRYRGSTQYTFPVDSYRAVTALATDATTNGSTSLVRIINVEIIL